jgi:hypothetical protein
VGSNRIDEAGKVRVQQSAARRVENEAIFRDANERIKETVVAFGLDGRADAIHL